MTVRVNFDGSAADHHSNALEEKLEQGLAQTRAAYSEQDDTVDIDDDALLTHVIEALKTVFDPEIPVNIYDLGLIYQIGVDEGSVSVLMTLTAPGCPVAHTFPGIVERTIELIPGVEEARVDLVWEPPWHQGLMSEEAKLDLGLI